MKLEERIQELQKIFKENEGLKVRKFYAFKKEFAILYLESFADFDIISKDILSPILTSNKKFDRNKKYLQKDKNNDDEPKDAFMSFLCYEVLFASEVTATDKVEKMVTKLMRGEKLILVDKKKEGILIDCKKLEKRAIVEPPTNNVINGPREGFIEDVNSNINLVRKRLVTSDLKIESLNVGRYTKTKVAIMYLTSIADKKVVKKIKERIKKIDIDGILDSYYLQDYLEELPNSIFKQVGFTEKPDILVGKMLEGRVGILVDGSPIALTLPFIIIEDLQGGGDYCEENNKVTFIRVLRLFGLMVSITMPGIYIALQLYHYKALPIKFLVTIINSSQNIPMPPAIEVLFAFFMFEILYEASIRTPKSLGSSFNIIGALILGDTAVKSNLASAPTIMIVALSSIAIYLLPEGINVVRILRFAMTLMGAILGIVGLCLGLIFVVGYLCDFDSYGADYLSPFTPLKPSDLKDSYFKANLRQMKKRPESLPQKNMIRQGDSYDEEK